MNTVAVGIGDRVKKGILQQIAGEGNPTVEVKDFSQLQKMIETIKASACSGVPPSLPHSLYRNKH